MSIGMAANGGHKIAKLQLAGLLEEARMPAMEVGLYVNGQPFEVLLAQVAQALRKQAAREPK